MDITQIVSSLIIVLSLMGVIGVASIIIYESFTIEENSKDE